TWRRSITCMASRSSTRCADPEAASPTDRPAPPPNLSRVGTIVDSHSSARTAADSGSIRSPRRTVLRRSMSRNRSKSATPSRTPRAAMRLQAQVARRSTDGGERDAALDELLAGTDRAARLVDAVLTLARYDAQQDPKLDGAAVDVTSLAHHVALEFKTRAAQR